MAPYHILIPMFVPICPENLVLLTENEQFGPKSAHICPTISKTTPIRILHFPQYSQCYRFKDMDLLKFRLLEKL